LHSIGNCKSNYHTIPIIGLKWDYQVTFVDVQIIM
jgi:hypothetical protein